MLIVLYDREALSQENSCTPVLSYESVGHKIAYRGFQEMQTGLLEEDPREFLEDLL